MALPPTSPRVPTSMDLIYNDIIELSKPFCDKHLTEEYFALLQQATAALCRKRPSPLTSGSSEVWACSILYSLGTSNFLFDKGTEPFVRSEELFDFFSVAASTARSRSKQIKDWLKINYYSHTWALPSRMEEWTPLWMISVDGFIIDVRNAPRELQEICLEKGLIPFIPTPPSRM